MLSVTPWILRFDVMCKNTTKTEDSLKSLQYG